MIRLTEPWRVPLAPYDFSSEFQHSDPSQAADRGAAIPLGVVLMRITGAKFVHTNLIARDWRALSGFYEEVFGCTSVPPERHFSGPDLEAATGVPGAELRGVHLRLPGCAVDGPTLEIFQYSELAAAGEPVPNRPGFAHIAFAVPSVSEARAQVLSHGGSPVGDIVTSTTETGSCVEWCYVADPEGNILELQSWL